MYHACIHVVLSHRLWPWRHMARQTALIDCSSLAGIDAARSIILCGTGVKRIADVCPGRAPTQKKRELPSSTPCTLESLEQAPLLQRAPLASRLTRKAGWLGGQGVDKRPGGLASGGQTRAGRLAGQRHIR